MEVAAFPPHNRTSGFPAKDDFEWILSADKNLRSPSTFKVQVRLDPSPQSDHTQPSWRAYKEHLLNSFSTLIDQRVAYVNSLKDHPLMRNYEPPNVKVIGWTKEVLERLRMTVRTYASVDSDILPEDFFPVFIFGVIQGGGISLEIRMEHGRNIYASFFNSLSPEIVFEEDGVSQEIDATEANIVDSMMHIYGYAKGR